ncbi:unnamed protein product, partial [Phaeothamnion confervicola]
MFWQLVVSEAAHRRAAAALEALVTPVEGGLLQPGDADRTAEELTRTCYMYYSGGDALTHEGMRHLREARALAASRPGTEDVRRAIEDGVRALVSAAGWWRDSAALEPRGVLRRACAELRRLQVHPGAIQVCLACAENFPPSRQVPVGFGSCGVGVAAAAGDFLLRATLTPVGPRAGYKRRSPGAGMVTAWTPQPGGGSYGSYGGSNGRDIAWDRSLYHGRAAASEEERARFRDVCYTEALTTLEELLSPVRAIAGAGPVDGRDGSSAVTPELRGALLGASLSQAICSEDRAFHYRLYDLLREHDAETLTRLRTTFVEDYLREADAELLAKFYATIGRHREASQLWASVASGTAATAPRRISAGPAGPTA